MTSLKGFRFRISRLCNITIEVTVVCISVVIYAQIVRLTQAICII